MQSDPHQRARFLIDEARVAGISPEDARWLRAHIADCLACARHEETTNRILHALTEFSAVGPVSKLPRLVLPPRKPALRVGWPLAVAAAILLAVAPLYKASRDARQERADALLLERVEAGVSRSVPAAMEPLMQP